MRIVETGGGLGDPWTLQLVSETGWRCGLSPNFTSLSSDLEDSSHIPSNNLFLGLFSPSVCPLHSCQSVFLRHIWFHTCHLNWLPRTLLVINSLLMEFNVQPRLGLPGRKLDHPRDPAWPSLCSVSASCCMVSLTSRLEILEGSYEDAIDVCIPSTQHIQEASGNRWGISKEAEVGRCYVDISLISVFLLQLLNVAAALPWCHILPFGQWRRFCNWPLWKLTGF